ncbi:MAG TPA: LLM class flavin-dependent oxidoreductase [Acidimicrobiales bacterium]|nr:LLM class flavin-dependent oxidoreductase [Acidimicrobiales bacterium]
MKFSMIFEAQMAFPTRENERQVIRDCVDQAVFAEQMGFDRVWAVEHHCLKWYAHMSAPEIFLTWVAARTSTIRIGHGVVCMPFNYNHPLRAAERIAMLDVLSNGRLDVGSGRGATLQEMSAFGVNPDDTYAQMEESLRIIANCWREDEFEWHGLLDIAPHPILPRPVQDPHPPLFMACTKKDTVSLAAELGVGALVLGFAGANEIRGMREIYDKTIASRTGDRFVSDHANNHFSALCPALVLDDRDKAFKIGARGQRFFAEAIMHWNLHTPPPNPGSEDEDSLALIQHDKDAVKAKISEMNIPFNPNSTNTYNIEHAYGDRDDAIRYVEELEKAGADEIMCMIQMGTIPQEAMMETIRQFGEYVIPHFRAKERAEEKVG